jgi:hypothetical protein
MDEDNRPAPNDRLIHRTNQILSGIVACAVLGVAGVMAYQNRDSLKVPDRNAAWSGFWTKKLSNTTAFPKANLPEFQAPDWENKINPSTFVNPSLQFAPGQFSSAPVSTSSRRRP